MATSKDGGQKKHGEWDAQEEVDGHEWVKDLRSNTRRVEEGKVGREWGMRWVIGKIGPKPRTMGKGVKEKSSEDCERGAWFRRTT